MGVLSRKYKCSHDKILILMVDQLNCLGRLPPPPGGWRGRQSASRTTKSRGHVLQSPSQEHNMMTRAVPNVCSLHEGKIEKDPPPGLRGWVSPGKDDNSEDWEERQDRRHTHRHQIYNSHQRRANLDVMIDVAVLGWSIPAVPPPLQAVKVYTAAHHGAQ